MCVQTYVAGYFVISRAPEPLSLVSPIFVLNFIVCFLYKLAIFSVYLSTVECLFKPSNYSQAMHSHIITLPKTAFNALITESFLMQLQLCNSRCTLVGINKNVSLYLYNNILTCWYMQIMRMHVISVDYLS